MKLKSYLLILTLSLSCFTFAQTGTDISGSFKCGDSVRHYTFYVPKLYDSVHAVPLVINMHGASGSSSKQEIAEDFRKIADTANFIIVHPQGLDLPLSPGLPIDETGWSVLGTVSGWQVDEDFIINLLDTLEAHYKINTSRVYLTGYSEGGFMCYEFACFTQSRFAAIASVSGSLIPSHFSVCNPKQPTPVMEIHGTSDQVIGYTGSGLTTSTDVDTMINYWVKHNHCNPIPDSIVHLPDVVDSATTDKSTVTHYVYTGGEKGTSVELYKVLGGGHTIPSSPPVPTGYGAGNTNEDFTAAKVIWRFFSKYNLDSLGVTAVVGGPPTVPVPYVAGINELQNNNSISVYPNPSNGIFTLYIENYQNTSFQLFNVLGSVIQEQQVSGEYSTINLNNAPKGIYHYKVINKNGVVKSGKLIVQ